MTENTYPPVIGTLRIETFGRERAVYWRDGVYAAEDFRYWAIHEFLQLSPSFVAVMRYVDGEESPYPLPRDEVVVRKVVEDFREVFAMEPSKWWRTKGKFLFGVPAPEPKIAIAGVLNGKRKALNVMWDRNDCVVARIASCQTKKEALRALGLELDKLTAKGQFGTSSTQEHFPKYSFVSNKIRESSLAVGAHALSYYMSDSKLPLWWIGNYVGVTPGQQIDQGDVRRMDAAELAYRKEVIGIATSRVIRNAILIAENAARGRFPCADPFPEAMVSAFQRKAGRPGRRTT